MRLPGLVYLPRLPFAALALAALLAAPGRAGDLRFSATIEAADRAACGLARLTSDQVAVLDAFVRRDTAARASATTGDSGKDGSAGGTFTQRLTAGERQTAGLGALTPAELAHLDATVDRVQNARLARTFLAPPTYVARRNPVIPTERKKEREIHGTFSLSYGVGSGGYSEKSGSMVLTLEDPAKGYSISVGYTETHTKGGVPYYLHRDPFYDPLRSLLHDPLRPD